MDDLSQYKCIWDGTDPGWVVARHTEDWAHLVVVFDNGAKVEDLKALRAVAPSLSRAPAAQIMTLKGVVTFDLGEHESMEARSLERLCVRHKLKLQVSGKTYRRYSIVNERTQHHLLIKDERLLEAVAKEAIKRGVRVHDSTV